MMKFRPQGFSARNAPVGRASGMPRNMVLQALEGGWGASLRARRFVGGNILPGCSERRALPVPAVRPVFRKDGGVALVITLILLAVISTLAIAFLGITQRETGAVDAMSRTTDAEVAADSALERAKAEITAVYPWRNQTNQHTTNVLGPDMIVSICCQNYDNVPTSPTFRRVIPYDRLFPDNRVTNRYDAAPPVFVQTNSAVDAQHPLDDRFFVDLNRNGIFEDSGHVPDTTDSALSPGRFQYDVSSGNISTNWRIGDPQWIGVLQNPRRPHGPNNRFIGRYAFMVVPAGRTLDVNWIHNDGAKRLVAGRDAFYREQGVGGWEVNLAGFLADLNTNQWGTYAANPYSYFADPNPAGIGGAGDAFADAEEILRYRAAGQDLATQLFPSAGNWFTSDQIDMYANGFGTTPNPDYNDQPNRPWPGSASRTNVFSAHDYFHVDRLTQRPNGFGKRLGDASVRGNSYDRYTFYRMLGQLGTDSPEDEDEGKININYVNIPSWATGERILASDLIPWSTNVSQPYVARLLRNVDMGRPLPELFFLSVVTNLLAREPALASFVTNRFNGTVLSIPVYTNRSTLSTNLPLPGPLYSARLHQILQIAANIFEATTGSKNGEAYPYYPTVFRPRFFTDATGVYIVDYVLLNDADVPRLRTGAWAWRDLDLDDVFGSPVGGTDLVYGIPLIIGARQGLPSFNELGVISVAQATRKVTLYRATAGKDWDKLEQIFSLQMRSSMQIEARNSNTNPYPRNLQFLVGLNARVEVKASSNAVPIVLSPWITGYATNILANRWPGEPVKSDGAKTTNHLALSPQFLTNLLNLVVITNADGHQPSNQWSLTLTNRMLFYLVDIDPATAPNGRIIDAVAMSRPHNHFEVGELMEQNLPGAPSGIDRIWSSADAGKYSIGIREQFDVSANPGPILGPATSTGEYAWGNYDNLTAKSRDDAATKWRDFIGDNSKVGTNQVPFTPSRLMVQANFFQVNDPMVHYNFEDLRNDPLNSVYGTESLLSARTNLSTSVGKNNSFAHGWNLGAFDVNSGEIPGQGTLDPTSRDPGVIHPAYWNFPTNLFPSIGWVGRVHRGTPWQSIYLKSHPLAVPGNWIDHTGNQRAGHPQSADLMQPVRDWDLLDIFTTAPHPNATRGRLSINQTNLAAWSAVLSGVTASIAEEDPDFPGYPRRTNQIVYPSGILPAVDGVRAIVESVNTNRTHFRSNFANPYGEYYRLGQVLAAPELSDRSPELTANPGLFDPALPHGGARIFDEDYERIPQEILSLLKVGEPRFVVYAWGQSLKPARLGVQYDGAGKIDPTQPLSGPSIDPATKVANNYQVTGEVATRAVVRVIFPERDLTVPEQPVNFRKPRLVVESFNIIPVE